MKILIVDHDEMAAQLIKSRLQPLGHQIFEETLKNNAVDRVASEEFDVIFIDPAPLTSARLTGWRFLAMVSSSTFHLRT